VRTMSASHQEQPARHSRSPQPGEVSLAGDRDEVLQLTKQHELALFTTNRWVRVGWTVRSGSDRGAS
jgi:hypothetical protein